MNKYYFHFHSLWELLLLYLSLSANTTVNNIIKLLLSASFKFIYMPKLYIHLPSSSNSLWKIYLCVPSHLGIPNGDLSQKVPHIQLKQNPLTKRGKIGVVVSKSFSENNIKSFSWGSAQRSNLPSSLSTYHHFFSTSTLSLFLSISSLSFFLDIFSLAH